METEYKRLSIYDIRESEINPQVMGANDFKRLVKSLKKDKTLTSAPLVMEIGKGKYVCISGHHRIRAAKAANIFEVGCIVIPETDKTTRLRLQLTHNDIHGDPDPVIIRQLQAEITEEDLRLCDLIEGETKKLETQTMNYEPPEYRYINLCLLPDTARVFEDLIDNFRNVDAEKYLIENQDYRELVDLLTEAFKAGFKTPGGAFRRFINVLTDHKDEL